MHGKNNRLALTSPILAVCLALALFSLACSGSHSVLEKTASSKPAAPSTKELKDFDVKMLDAEAIKLSALRAKGKVLVVDFWATWCGPCRQEIPHLVALQNEYRDKGVEVIGLSIENPAADAEKVRTFAKEFAINYQLGFSTYEMFAAFNGNDPGMAIPQTFIFGRDGNLIEGGHIRGMNPRFMREMLQERIEKALQTSGTTS